jgi:outer membrane biosynthesis protein TonB
MRLKRGPSLRSLRKRRTRCLSAKISLESSLGRLLLEVFLFFQLYREAVFFSGLIYNFLGAAKPEPAKEEKPAEEEKQPEPQREPEPQQEQAPSRRRTEDTSSKYENREEEPSRPEPKHTQEVKQPQPSQNARDRESEAETTAATTPAIGGDRTERRVCDLFLFGYSKPFRCADAAETRR